jgi:hypothetical protein
MLEALRRFPGERSVVADALTCCDLTTAADGSLTTPEGRISDVLARYGDDHPVGRAIRRSREQLFERLLRFYGAGGAIAE